MKILAIDCSQRERSNSGRLLDAALDAVRARTDCDATRVALREKSIECLGCERCLSDAAAHGDELASVVRELLSADLLLLAMPTCYGTPPAAAKAFMDRTDPFWFGRALQGKKAAVIVNGASPGERIEECARAVRWFFEAHGMEPLKASPCFGDSEEHPDQRYPDPLPDAMRAALDELADEIAALAG